MAEIPTGIEEYDYYEVFGVCCDGCGAASEPWKYCAYFAEDLKLEDGKLKRCVECIDRFGR